MGGKGRLKLFEGVRRSDDCGTDQRDPAASIFGRRALQPCVFLTQAPSCSWSGCRPISGEDEVGLPDVWILGVFGRSFAGKALGGANLPGTGVLTDFLQEPVCASPFG